MGKILKGSNSKFVINLFKSLGIVFTFGTTFSCSDKMVNKLNRENEKMLPSKSKSASEETSSSDYSLGEKFDKCTNDENKDVCIGTRRIFYGTGKSIKKDKVKNQEKENKDEDYIAEDNDDIKQSEIGARRILYSTDIIWKEETKKSPFDRLYDYIMGEGSGYELKSLFNCLTKSKSIYEENFNHIIIRYKHSLDDNREQQYDACYRSLICLKSTLIAILKILINTLNKTHEKLNKKDQEKIDNFIFYQVYKRIILECTNMWCDLAKNCPIGLLVESEFLFEDKLAYDLDKIYTELNLFYCGLNDDISCFINDKQKEIESKSKQLHKDCYYKIKNILKKYKENKCRIYADKSAVSDNELAKEFKDALDDLNKKFLEIQDECNNIFYLMVLDDDFKTKYKEYNIFYRKIFKQHEDFIDLIFPQKKI